MENQMGKVSNLALSKEKNKRDLNDIINGTDLHPVDKFASLKEDINKILSEINTLTNFFNEFDTDTFNTETTKLKEVQREFVNVMNEEISNVNRFREELSKSIVNCSNTLNTDLVKSIDALAAKKGLILDKSEETYNEAKKTANEIIEKSLKELRLANAELSKNAARLANPAKYMNKQDVLLMFGAFLLGGIIMWGSMTFFSHKIIDSYFQGALTQAVYETALPTENETPQE